MSLARLASVQACLSLTWSEISRLISDFLVGHIVFIYCLVHVSNSHTSRILSTQACLSLIWSEISRLNSTLVFRRSYRINSLVFALKSQISSLACFCAGMFKVLFGQKSDRFSIRGLHGIMEITVQQFNMV